MPAFIAPLLGFVLGIAFAWAAADEIASDPTSVLGSRALVVAALFSVLVFAPAAGYFVAFDGDWAFAYLVNTQRLPSAVVLALVLVDASSVPIGFVLAAPHARRRRLAPVLTLAAIPVGIALLCTLIFSRRLGIAATWSQYHGDFGTRSVAGTPLGYALIWMDGVLALAVALTMRELRLMSAKVRSRSSGMRSG
ncbi:MAG: hypothetical protein HY898_32455 [Deltaproteobacteria bacterium]|nr:hypothetical protein [Deltaproteobacteria bacterium]